VHKKIFLHHFSERQVCYACLFWFLFIAFLCGIPGKDIPHVSFFDILNFDKLVHAGIFFILNILLLEWFKRKRKLVLSAFLICIFYGGLLEILQHLIFKDRSADWMDFTANSFGSLFGYFYKKIFDNTFTSSLN
jgi:hypothetical protein